jgi:hypothetical protein
MSWSRGLIHILTLKCEGASLLASRELDEPLGRGERLAMWGHLLACASCRRFRGQVRFLRRAIHERRVGTDGNEDGLPALSPEARDRIERAMAEAIRRDDGADGTMQELT